MVDHRDASTEIPTDAADVVRFGTIESVDLAAATCTVEAGDLVTGPIPWITFRAGATRSWSPPSIGEQVLLLVPDGEIAGAVAVPGLFSDAHAAPGDSLRELIRFEDGAEIAYDPQAHALSATLPDGATVAIVAPGGVTIDVGDAALTVHGNVDVTGDITCTGTVTAETDVIGGGKSLKSHKHGQTQPGGGQTGQPA